MRKMKLQELRNISLHFHHESPQTIAGCMDSVTAGKSSGGRELGKWNMLLVFSPFWRGLNKALPEFLIWLLVNFYYLWKAKNPGQHQQHLVESISLILYPILWQHETLKMGGDYYMEYRDVTIISCKIQIHQGNFWNLAKGILAEPD